LSSAPLVPQETTQMSRRKRDHYFSVEHEPALAEQPFEPDPAEQRAASLGEPQGELEVLRDSAAAEPVLSDAYDPQWFGRWLARRRAQSTTLGNLGATLLAALLGGPAAVLGALVAGRQGAPAAVYLVVVGPVVEELLKQCGMTWLLEHRPYRIFAAAQFVAAGLLSGLAALRRDREPGLLPRVSGRPARGATGTRGRLSLDGLYCATRGLRRRGLAGAGAGMAAYAGCGAACTTDGRGGMVPLRDRHPRLLQPGGHVPGVLNSRPPPRRVVAGCFPVAGRSRRMHSRSSMSRW